MKTTYRIFALAFVLMVTLASCGGKKANSGNNKDSSSSTTSGSNEAEGSSESLQSGDQSEGSSVGDPKIAEVIQTYCDHFSSFKYKDVQSLFANDVKQYIGLKNTTGAAIAKEANRFLSSKRFVSYSPDLDELQVKGKTATVPINIEWAGYETRVSTQIEFNDAYKIVSFKEVKVLSQKYDNLKTSRKKIVETYQGCDHTNKKQGCTYYLADYQIVETAPNNAIKEAINRYVYKALDVTEPSVAGVRQAAKSFIGSFDEIRKSGSAMSDFMNDSYGTIRNMGKYVIVNVANSGYSGGAHGYDAISVANFDINTGKKLALTDLITSEAALKKIATKIFRKLNQIPDDKTINQYGYSIDDNEKLVFAQSFALKKNQIEFYYGRYEAGPYVMPPPMLNIKYSEIKDLIKKDGVLGDKVK
ncbi:MAG TPA: hypothetical protein DCS93_20325 [Microscillaceae bacterium]|nr:hypothetical protein [Microscillaceae bacterium]